MGPPRVGHQRTPLQATTVCTWSIASEDYINSLHADSTWSLNHIQEQPPTLPPRHSPGPTAYMSRVNTYPQSDELAQGWHSHSPQFSPSHFPNIPYNPHSYSVRPGVSQSPVDASWDNELADKPNRGVHSNYNQTPNPDPPPRPPLPVGVSSSI